MKDAKLAGKERRQPRLTQADQSTLDRQNLRHDLGQRLREAREQKDIGLRELARRLGVSASLISQIETGKTEPSINTLFAMVSELELSVNEIVFDAKEAQRPLSAAGRARDGGQHGRKAQGAGPEPAEPPDSPVVRSTSRTSISLE